MRIPIRWRLRSKLSLLFLLLPLALAGGQELGELSLAYLEQAEQALSDGAEGEAERYLETALSLTPELADAMIALAAFRGERGAVTEAIDLLETALAEGRFLRASEDRARIDLARLYVRVRRAEEALETLGRVRLPSREALYLRGLAALEADELSEARTAADRGRALYPEDPRFVDLSYRVDPLTPVSIEGWIEENRSEDPAYLRLLARFLLTVEERGEFRDLGEEYFSLGGSDAAVAARYADLLDDGVERFLELEGPRDKYALEVAAESLSPESSRELLRAAREALEDLDPPVRLGYDPDRDGYENGAFYWEGSRIARWERDEDQDGRYEVVVHFGGAGAPEEVAYPTGARLSYGVYPYLGSAELQEERATRTLFLMEDRLAHHAVTEEISWYAERRDLFHRYEIGGSPPDLELLRRYAALEVVEEESGGRTYRQLLGGVPLLAYRDARGEGVIEELRLFSEGRMSHALLDPDGDGNFELYERFDGDGVLIQGVDEDGTGRSEVFNTALDEMARWDSDEDGSLDFGVVTDELRAFMEIEGRMRNNLEYQLELFGDRTAR
ncbi:MAG: hypothetical protein ACLFPP_00975 [Spirochaetaceae bacterium]